MKKKILAVLLIVLIIVIPIFVFYQNILNMIGYIIYEIKYAQIENIDKELTFNRETNLLEDNLVNINDLNITLSNLEYTENNLNFTLKFSHSKPLNKAGYVLRVFNDDYFLGERTVFPSSLSTTDWLMYQKVFYKKVFKNSKDPIIENNLLNVTHLENFPELLDDGTLLHNISFTFPEDLFIVKDTLNIVLFDINYQNIGDKNYYKVNDSLIQVNYTINNN